MKGPLFKQQAVLPRASYFDVVYDRL